MKIKLITSFSLFLLLIASHVQAQDNNEFESTFVLVHGATGGAWDWRQVDRILSAKNHDVYRPTLTGLGERIHLANPDVDLNTHVLDVVNLILFEDLNDVVLVGHSYGGMVITGVMNTVPERIRHAIFLDALVPDHGMSALNVLGIDEEGRLPDDYKVIDGQIIYPWLDMSNEAFPRDVPQSLKTYTQPVSFDNRKAHSLAATYIEFIDQGQTDFSGNMQTAKKRGWSTLTMDSDHNAQRSKPEELSKLLQSVLD